MTKTRRAHPRFFVVGGYYCPPFLESELKEAAALLAEDRSESESPAIRDAFLALVSDRTQEFVASGVARIAESKELPYHCTSQAAEIGIGSDLRRKQHDVFFEAARATRDPVGSMSAFVAGYLAGLCDSAWSSREELKLGMRILRAQRHRVSAANLKGREILREYYAACEADPDAGEMLLYKRVVEALKKRGIKTTPSSVCKRVRAWMDSEADGFGGV